MERTAGAAGQFHELHRRDQKKTRYWADFASAYGPGVIPRITPEIRLGLWLNQQRAQYRRAAFFITACAELVSGTGTAVLESITETPEQANDMAADLNDVKAEQQFQSQMEAVARRMMTGVRID